MSRCCMLQLKGAWGFKDQLLLLVHVQDRMKAGPSFGARLNPRLLAAITQNPELLQVIMSRTRVAGVSNAGADDDDNGPGGCTIS